MYNVQSGRVQLVVLVEVVPRTYFSTRQWKIHSTEVQVIFGKNNFNEQSDFPFAFAGKGSGGFLETASPYTLTSNKQLYAYQELEIHHSLESFR
mmetsp:Transcript_20964/g.39178  ORF Transcript_20964/g.39178 Transcript_20964/m.39178 type:complete len:94 (+) Transcript_20964:58-339(+)